MQKLTRRYVLVARLRGITSHCRYVSRIGGCITSSAERAYVYRSAKDVGEDLEYFRRMEPRYDFAVEQLPRGTVANAILRAVDVTLAIPVIDRSLVRIVCTNTVHFAESTP